MEKLKFKKLDYTVTIEEGKEEVRQSEGKLPNRAHPTDAGLDLFCTRVTQEPDNSGKLVLVYHTDIAVEIPEGYVGLLFMKSSISNKSIIMANAVDVIDSDYRGELMAKFKVTTDAIPTIYTLEEAFAQLVIVPIVTPTPEFVEELSQTERGEGGFGSTQAVQEVTEQNIVE